MKKLLLVTVLASVPTIVAAADKPDWAFGPFVPAVPPLNATVAPVNPPEDGKRFTIPGSTQSFTRTRMADPKNPQDWFPNEHAPMPSVVAHGNSVGARACITCHSASGRGNPENSRVPGGTEAYLIRQLEDFKSGARKGWPVNMIAIAKGMSDQEIKDAAKWFASLKTSKWTKVVETDTVPVTTFTPGNMGIRIPGNNATEVLGNRIIEIPEDEDLVRVRDPRAGFVAYVPKGSVAKGQNLVATGGDGKTVACTICHGPTLQGIGDVPGIAGRSPLNIARQLYYFQNGDRSGGWAQLMKGATEKLTKDDMLNISAYVASLDP